jgi:cytochrome c5
MLKANIGLLMCCLSFGVLAADKPAAANRASKLYQTYCHACHGSGLQGAPVTGKMDDWSSRLEAGVESLLEVTKKGMKTMPPKGSCSECSDAELTAIIEMMIQEPSGK